MCSQCNGAEQDYGTVDRHMKEVYIPAHTSEFDNSHDLTLPPNAHSMSSVPDGHDIPGMSGTANVHEQCCCVKY